MAAYCNNNDETYCGISRSKNPDWPGWKTIDFCKTLQPFPRFLDQENSELNGALLFIKKELDCAVQSFGKKPE